MMAAAIQAGLVLGTLLGQKALPGLSWVCLEGRLAPMSSLLGLLSRLPDLHLLQYPLYS